MAKSRRIPAGMVFNLASADLRHEWTLTLCLMLSIAAVIAPLLLLFGLKYGTIETLRDRLVQDPSNREIRPLINRTFEREWFEQIRTRDDVEFAVPMTRQISSMVSAWVKVDPTADEAGIDNKTEIELTDMSLVPTSTGDPLLEENHSSQPVTGQCAMSYYAADAIHAQIGDTITLEASRTRSGRREKGEVDLKLIGILDRRATPQKTVYVPLELLEQVEAFKDGQAVAELGWKGDAPEAYPMWDGIVVSTPDPLPPLIEHQLRANTGFTKLRKLDANAPSLDLGYTLPADRSNILLYTAIRSVGNASYVSVQTQLRGRSAVLLNWVKPKTATLVGQGIQKEIVLRALPSSAHTIHTHPVPPWDNALAGGSDLLKIYLPASWGLGNNETLTLQFDTENEVSLSFPVTVFEFAEPALDTAFVPARLAGILNLAKSRPLLFDASTSTFLLNRKGYAGFRLYAATLESVEGLRVYFESEGIPVHTEASKIESVLEMDRYLTLIFWLIAVVGILGSVAALVASLYASVERKRKELSVLRLLGFSAGQLFRYPVYQGVLIAIGGFVMAWAAFYGIGETINRLFATHLQSGESFCALPYTHLGAAFAGTVLLACAAAFAAVIKLARIEPAESLRDE